MIIVDIIIVKYNFIYQSFFKDIYLYNKVKVIIIHLYKLYFIIFIIQKITMLNLIILSFTTFIITMIILI